MDLTSTTSAKKYLYSIDPDSDTAGAQVLRLVGTNKNVLELGAGPGGISRPLVKLNMCQVTALEMDSASVQILRDFCHHVVQADLNAMDWTSKLPAPLYEVVVIADVLEHLYDPWKTLRQVHDLIPDDGCVVVSIPHSSHAALIACLLEGDIRYSEWGLLDKTHIRFFSLANIQTLFEGAGLKIIDACFVLRHPTETEFKDIWEGLPHEAQALLDSKPEGHIYQAVVKAVRADTHPDTKSCLLIDFLAPKQVDVRYIAFYLPQFHPVPENDKWWGKGFTEWTNVSKAWPMFDGHYQPHLPADFGFYDLRVRDVQRQQIEYAKTNGIDAFCFHYYSFGERRILERPLEDYLADSEADFPFCLCWANENWTRRWDAADQEVLIAQDYSPANDVSLIEDLLRFFRDRRYVRINGAPLLVVYRPQQLPDAKATAARWRSICRDSGIGEIHLVAALTHGNWDYESLGFDAGVEFPPHDPGVPTCLDEVRPYVEIEGFILRYGALAERYLANDYRNRLVYRGVCPSWDNSARVQTRALITLDATPDNYERWLSRTTSLTLQERSPQERLVFINAWNEWAEGCHLEPDRRYGMAWLDATLRVKAGRSVVSRVFESVDGLTLSVRKPRPLIRWIDRGLKGTPQLHRRAQAIWGRILNGKSRIFRDSTLVN
jgi:2-polyprenyl-3-methyl-5-hydroxy-6-metoxy-1,4-benzoquinol methylase